MVTLNYLDFDLVIERAADKYRARVLSSPAGYGAADFSLPFSDLELENFILRVGRTRRGVRRIDSPEMESAKTFGGRLFSAVFDGEVRGCLRSSIDQAGRQGAGLRIRIRFSDAPNLATLPWEYLYNPSLNRFLVLSSETPLVRYLELPERIQPLAIKPPLRILVMISSPRDYPPLEVDREWSNLDEALRDFQQRGLVTLERLSAPTLISLQRRLRQGEYHIFHFVGHGGFNEQTQDGILLLEDATQRGHPVSGQDLGTMLHDHRPLRLVVLNACEGARTSLTDPFAGAAQSLVQQGIPAVIAMQFEITDQAAITLAREFYGAVADGYPVDAAMAEARKAIFATGNDVEWGTPVLYLRAPDGRIFDVTHLSELESKPALARQDVAAVVPQKEIPAPVTKPSAPPPVQAPPAPKAKGANWIWVGGGIMALAVLVCAGLGIVLAQMGLFGGGRIPTPLPTATFVASLSTTPRPTAVPPAPTVAPLPVPDTPIPPTIAPTRADTAIPPTAVPTRTYTPPPPQPVTVFEDRFDGSGLDSSKWVGYNSAGIAIGNGVLRMASTSNRFPYVYSRANLFPASGNFRLTVGFRYTSIGVCGVAILMTGYDPGPLAGLSQDDAASRQQAGEQSGVAAGVWQDNGTGLQFWYRSGAERPNISVSGQDTSSRILTVEYRNSQYTASVSGRGSIFTSQRTTNRPRYMWMGHPATLGVPCNWDSLEVDSVKVETLP